MLALCVNISISQVVNQKLTPEEIDKITSINKLLEINNNAIMNDEFAQSMASAKKLVELEPNNSNFNYRYGMTLNQSANDLKIPLSYLKKAAENVGKNVDLFKNTDKSPVEAYFNYAVALHRYGEVSVAIKYYHQFLNQVKNTHPLYKVAELGLKQAENATKIPSNSDVISIHPITDLDGKYSDFSPITSFDGSSLYFSSDRPWERNGVKNQLDLTNNKYHEAIYIAYPTGKGDFSKPQLLPFNASDENISSVSVSLDERVVYIYSSSTGNGDIYYSNFKNGKFSDIKPLENNAVNTKDYQSHYFVSADNRLALFTSEMKGGQGGLDIWMMKRQKDGSWSKPENLGSEINSKYDEDSPFLSFDGKTLYYSSNSERSIGGYDIFKADYVDGKFVNSTNLGTPINSTYDDIFYTVTSDGKTAYLSSFRKGGKGGLDLYSIQLKANNNNSVLFGRVYMANIKDSIPEYVMAKLVCKTCQEPDTIDLIPRLRDGKFFASLDKCKDYDLVYVNTNNNQTIATQSFSTECKNQYEEIHKELGIDSDNGVLFADMHYAIQGIVYDKETKLPLKDAKVEIQTVDGKSLQTKNTIAIGQFTSDELKGMQPKKDYHYKLIVSKPDYITVSREITVTGGDMRIIPIDSIPLEKNEENKDLAKVIALNPIYYDFDKYNLRPVAKVELDKIVEIMNLNPTMTIDLRSHTDCRGSDAYNMRLSNQRAKAAIDYLKAHVKNGANRLTGRGYGETQLLSNCGCDSGCTEEEHQMNRRTEFIITHK